MFYWLDSFAQCLACFFHQGVWVQTPPLILIFNILRRVDLEEMYGLFCKKMTQDDRWNWCFKYSRDWNIWSLRS
jgi:hypothetical protein